VDYRILKDNQRLERKCITLGLEVETFREWEPKRDMELDAFQNGTKIFDVEKQSLIGQLDEVKKREDFLLARVERLTSTQYTLFEEA
jgi:hypothetical protein